MNAESVTEAARILWQTWRKNRRIDALPAACRPADRGAGYAIAEAVAAASGQPVIGWKIAATSEAGQRHINVDGPLAGRLLGERVFESGAAIELDDNIMRVAEAEFAFSFAHDLPKRTASYVQSEVMEAIDSVHLSIEIPDSRYHDFTTVGAAQLIADTACASWLVTAPSLYKNWHDIDFASHPIMLSRNGREAGRGTGKAALGDPRTALTWLVNEVATYAAGIKRGDLVTTGTCIIPAVIGPGDRIEVDYAALGSISVQIT